MVAGAQQGRLPLHKRRRREEAAAGAVRALAAPELAVRRGLRFGERDCFVLDRPHAGERALNDDIAFARHDDALLRYDEAVDLAAAEFAVGVTKKAREIQLSWASAIEPEDNDAANNKKRTRMGLRIHNVPSLSPCAATTVQAEKSSPV